jgi:hypothetical protein
LTSRSRIFMVSGRLQSVSVAGDVPKVRDDMIGTLIKAAYVHTRCKKKNKNSKKGQRARSGSLRSVLTRVIFWWI